jgi:hypothetical protein
MAGSQEGIEPFVAEDVSHAPTEMIVARHSERRRLCQTAGE